MKVNLVQRKCTPEELAELARQKPAWTDILGVNDGVQIFVVCLDGKLKFYTFDQYLRRQRGHASFIYDLHRAMLEFKAPSDSARKLLRRAVQNARWRQLVKQGGDK